MLAIFAPPIRNMHALAETIVAERKRFRRKSDHRKLGSAFLDWRWQDRGVFNSCFYGCFGCGVPKISVLPANR
jgi:hypothetical protein